MKHWRVDYDLLSLDRALDTIRRLARMDPTALDQEPSD